MIPVRGRFSSKLWMFVAIISCAFLFASSFCKPVVWQWRSPFRGVHFKSCTGKDYYLSIIWVFSLSKNWDVSILVGLTWIYQLLFDFLSFPLERQHFTSDKNSYINRGEILFGFIFSIQRYFAANKCVIYTLVALCLHWNYFTVTHISIAWQV